MKTQKNSIKKMHRSLLIIVILLGYDMCLSQEQISNDSSTITVRHFSSAAITGYKADQDFQYDRIIEPPKSVWDRFWEWFWQKVAQTIGSRQGGRIFNIILILLAAAILTFFIIKLTGMQNSGLFGKKNTGNALDYSIHDENIHTINFDAAIQEAVDKKNYRVAVRLLYLQCLKLLTDRRLINWQVNKTNVTYVQELSGSTYQQSFRDLTFQFENNWYGDLPIEESEFIQVKDHFNQFNRQLK